MEGLSLIILFRLRRLKLIILLLGISSTMDNLNFIAPVMIRSLKFGISRETNPHSSPSSAVYRESEAHTENLQ